MTTLLEDPVEIMVRRRKQNGGRLWDQPRELTLVQNQNQTLSLQKRRKGGLNPELEGGLGREQD